MGGIVDERLEGVAHAVTGVGPGVAAGGRKGLQQAEPRLVKFRTGHSLVP
ncbi:hypothetical protein ACFFJB_06675 [Camelimonas abortus]